MIDIINLYWYLFVSICLSQQGTRVTPTFDTSTHKFVDTDEDKCGGSHVVVSGIDAESAWIGLVGKPHPAAKSQDLPPDLN